MKQILSSQIGPLTQSKEFDDWWISSPVAVPFFDHQKLSVTFFGYVPEEDSTFLEEADRALANFLQKGPEVRVALSEPVFENCREFLEDIGYDEQDKPLWEIQDKNKIWKFVQPSELTVERRHRRDKDVYLSIVCNCDWEQEHGLQLVFRRGTQLTRVSAQDGHLTTADAYDLPDDKDQGLSAFNQ